MISQQLDVSDHSLISATDWSWPGDRHDGEPFPDARLLHQNISGLRARITVSDGVIVTAPVRAVSQHDLLLAVSDTAAIPVQGQVVELTLQWQNWDVVATQQAIVHWSADVYGQHLVGLFMVEALGEAAEQWQCPHTRGEVRFPVRVPAVVHVTQQRQVPGQIVDYSLNGCRFLADDLFDLDVTYPVSVLLPTRSVELSLRPRWVLQTDGGYQMGCTFQREQGVLLAIRHHPVMEPPNIPVTNFEDVLEYVDYWR